MSQSIMAVYEHGLLRPLKPLKLKEHQTIRIQILPEFVEDRDQGRLNLWISLGLVTPPLKEAGSILEKTRNELADRLGSAVHKPLSEVILEERGDW